MVINIGDVTTIVVGIATIGVSFGVVKASLAAQQTRLDELKVKVEADSKEIRKDGAERFDKLLEAITQAVHNTSVAQLTSVEKMVGSFTGAINKTIEMHQEYKEGFVRVHSRIDDANRDMNVFKNDMMKDFVSKDTCNANHARINSIAGVKSNE